MQSSIPQKLTSNNQVAEILSVLEQDGVALLQGMQLDLLAYESFTQNFCDRFYMEGRRLKLMNIEGDGLTTSVEQGSGRALLPHSEGHYPPRNSPPPDLCFFYAPQHVNSMSSGTSVVNGGGIYTSLPTLLRERFEQQGIIYEMKWHPERWKAVFEVETVTNLRSRLRALPTTHYHLGSDQHLHMRHSASVISRLESGNKVFTSGMLSHLPSIPDHPPYHNDNTYHDVNNQVYFGNGEKIPETVIKRLIDCYAAHTYVHQWRAGDLLILDNLRFMHGRELSLAGNHKRLLYTRFGWRPDHIHGDKWTTP